jgi:hypothetical protein
VRRNLRIHALVDFRGGNFSWSQTASQAHFNQRNTRTLLDRSDPILAAYDSLNRAGTVPGITQRATLMNAGFAKLREVSLTYTLPTAWVARFGAASASITVAGRNLATLWAAQRDIFGFKIADPETRGPTDLGASVNNLMPPFRQFMTALRVTY